jgi:F0F1-type ATP synthase membrane subunit b/b'
MQEFISFIKFLATSNTINFILMLMILGWVVKKVNVGKSFDTSISAIKSNIDKSDDVKKQSSLNLKEAKKLIDDLPKEVKSLKSNTAEKVDIFKTQIAEDAKKTIAKLGTNADKILQTEEKKLSNVVTLQTSNDIINLAEERIIEQLKKTPQLHNQFILNSIDELDKVILK